MIKISAEASCPLTYYEELMKKDFNKWSKMQLVAYINVNSDADAQVTLRPRKSTLVTIAEKIKPNNVITPTVEQWMEFTDPKQKEATYYLLPGFIIFCLGALIVYGWELGLSFGEMGGLAAVAFLLFGIPAYVWYIER